MLKIVMTKKSSQTSSHSLLSIEPSLSPITKNTENDHFSFPSPDFLNNPNIISDFILSYNTNDNTEDFASFDNSWNKNNTSKILISLDSQNGDENNDSANFPKPISIDSLENNDNGPDKTETQNVVKYEIKEQSVSELILNISDLNFSYITVISFRAENGDDLLKQINQTMINNGYKPLDNICVNNDFAYDLPIHHITISTPIFENDQPKYQITEALNQSSKSQNTNQGTNGPFYDALLKISKLPAEKQLPWLVALGEREMPGRFISADGAMPTRLQHGNIHSKGLSDNLGFIYAELSGAELSGESSSDENTDLDSEFSPD